MNSRRIFRWILALGALFAGFASLIIGLHQSVWFDEAYSILLAKHSVAQIIHLTSLDTHPPLYYMLLKGWAHLFGWSELALRSLSVLAMVGALLIGGLLARKMFGYRVAAGTVVVLALSPLLLRYGFEIRMYALASLVGVAASYCLYSAYRASGAVRTKWLVAYGLLVAVGVYTLYYISLLWFAHVVWIAYMAISKKWNIKELVPYALSYCGAVLLFLPWLPKFIPQISNGALAPIGQPMNYEQLSGVLSFNVLYRPSSALTVGLTVALLAFIAAIVWAIVRGRRALRAYKPEFMLLGCYIGVPIVALMVISLSRAMYTERYLSHVAIGLMMLLSALLVIGSRHITKRRWLFVLMAFAPLCVGTMMLATTGNFNFQRNEHPTVNVAASNITNCAAGTQLIAADPYVATEMNYYLPDCHMYFVSQWDTLGGGYAPFSGSTYQIKDTKDITAPFVTYIYYGTPDQAIPDTYSVINTQTYGALNITEYKRS